MLSRATRQRLGGVRPGKIRAVWLALAAVAIATIVGGCSDLPEYDGTAIRSRAPALYAQKVFVLAKKGDPDGEYRYFWCLVQGIGVERNTDAALSWLKRSAHQDYANAENELGALYEYGSETLGVQRNEPKALYWYTRLADHGSAKGYSKLAMYAADGKVVPKDLHKAARLFRRSMNSSEDKWVLNNGAWFFATVGDTSLRDGPYALKVMQKVVLKYPGYSGMDDTLAAAYAACGRYEEAVLREQTAIQEVKDDASEKLLLDKHLGIFKDGKALTEF